MSPAKDMQGLSEEERRKRANEMLKAKSSRSRRSSAKTRKPSGGDTETRQIEAERKELAAKERELEERARRLEQMEKELESGAKKADRSSDRRRPVRTKRPAADDESGASPSEEDADTPAEPDQATRPLAAISRRLKARGSRDDDTVEAVPVEAEAPKRRRPKSGLLLEITGMSVHYGQIQALRNVEMAIKPGEVIALLGANGAGKSSTLKAIAGVVSPSGGDIIFEGESIAGLPAQEVVKRGIALVPEGRELFPTLSVEENLRLGYWPRRHEKGGLKKAYEQVYEMFPRLAERRAQAAGTMSGGEQQMLVFGRALMSQPKLLMADEMSLGLAPLIVRTLFEAIEVIHQAGASVIIVEQFVHQALRHTERAYVLSKGEISLEAASEKLADDPQLLAAYLGGAEGGIEEVAETKPKKGGSSKGKSASKKRASSRSKS